MTKNLIFIHIPRTAGESIEFFFSQKQNSLIKKINYFFKKKKIIIPSFYHGLGKHDSLQKITEVISPSSDDEFFTIVRNPYDRIKSFYNHLKRWEWDPRYDGILPKPQIPAALAQIYDFNEWLNIVLDEKLPMPEKNRKNNPVDLFKPMIEFLGVNFNIYKLNILKFENLAKDWEEFSKKNELPRKLPHLNASRGIKIEYNDEGIAAVNKKYNEDFKTFNYKMFNTALDEKNYNIY